MLYKASLQIGVCIDYLLQSITQLGGIGICHHHYVRNVILRGVTVHLPVEEHASLVLGDGIIVVLAL